jgi:hypothetical protein
MKKYLTPMLVIILVVVLSITVACGPKAPATPEATEPPAAAPTEPPEEEETEEPAAPEPTEESAPAEEEESVEYDTVFPLPEDVQGFTGEGGEAMINFQTSLGLEEVVGFYRDTLTTQGLTERELLTVVEDTTCNLVFDGSENGQAVVVQCVDMGEVTNVNVRFEDV